MDATRFEVADKYRIDYEDWVIIKEMPTDQGYYNYMLMSIATGNKRTMGGSMVARLSDKG